MRRPGWETPTFKVSQNYPAVYARWPGCALCAVSAGANFDMCSASGVYRRGVRTGVYAGWYTGRVLYSGLLLIPL